MSVQIQPQLRYLLLGLIAWEFVGDFDLVAGGALPSPSEILHQAWLDRGDYGGHIAATLQAAAIGFAIGNLVAIFAALCFVRWPVTAKLCQGINVALFALPPIAVVPILLIAFDGMTPRYILAAISVYFPTMTAMLVGLSEIDPRAADVVRAYGGGPFALLRLVRLRSSMPALLGGLRVAAPNAVLGAILAEFGGGARWGLGTYLLGSLGQANPARLWGIGLAATLIAGLAYFAFALLARRMTGATRAVTIASGALPQSERGSWITLIVAIMLPFIIWWLLLALLGISPIVAKTPFGLIDYLFLAGTAESAQTRLLAALFETLPLALLGMAAGLAIALGLAVLGEVKPAVARTLLPIALVTQTMPLVALTPLLVLLLGRGIAVTIAITVSVTFFPAFVTIAQGLQLVSRAAFDLCRAYGASPLRELWLVALPSALPYLFAAAKLAVPRALLGVMIAEWLATGRGLGNLMNQSRGFLDYGMIWTVAIVSVLISLVFYQAIVLVERRWRR
ncbi:MAG: ABC transporter permease subunit [Alphaproteobacteria bacterium]|nr:ABC transporter permease subunit [Alphaproteobacteria bacterium]